MAKTKASGTAGVEKKLRQAEFFLGHLEQATREMVNDVARDPERLEFFFSACLTAAQSAYYILDESYAALKACRRNGAIVSRSMVLDSEE